MIKWPDDLVLALARRRAVVFLGAGISSNSTNVAGARPCLWADFLKEAIAATPGSQALRKAISQVANRRDYLTACEMIKDKMGANAFHGFVKKKFVDPGFGPADIHKTIVKLDSRIVATPNFDKIYDGCANTLLNNTVLVKNYHDADIAEVIRSTSRMVLKVHGGIDHPPQMIFTRTDYANARHEYRSFYSILEALILTHTFLFLGCGTDDPDIRLILEDHAFKHAYTAPHYFVASDDSMPSPIRPYIERGLSVKVLTYSFAGAHQELRDSLDALEQQVASKRADLAVKLDW